jgi:hypothetical protein
MQIENTSYDIDYAAIHSLKLPDEYDTAIEQTAIDIDHVLDQKDTRVHLSDKIDLHRHAGIAYLKGNYPFEVFNPDKYKWPQYLFIPKDANATDYWIGAAPGNQRYALAWTTPAGSANTASAETGNLFAFSQLLNERPAATQSSTAAVGVFYEPSFTLGVVDFQPAVNFTAAFRTALEYFPALSAGGVQIYAELVLTCWQQIPGPNPFDLIGSKSFAVATSGRRDQSSGKELQQFQKSFDGPDLSAPFVVQRGRKYLFAATARITVVSNLISSHGEPLPVFNSTQLKVWGSLTCVIPQISIFTKRVDIP